MALTQEIKTADCPGCRKPVREPSARVPAHGGHGPTVLAHARCRRRLLKVAGLDWLRSRS